MTGDITKLLEFAEPFLPNSWLKFFTMVLIAAGVTSIVNKTHAELWKSAHDWQKTLGAVKAIAVAVVGSAICMRPR